jgi:group I intron endonuclease
MKENNIIVPIMSYPNAEKNEQTIFKDNKNKSGIYRWNNLITGKSYVGSAISLNDRFWTYYSLNTLKCILNRRKSAIYSAIIKYGHSKFSLDILEYCEPSILILKEQYYIDNLNPEYNILKVAGSRLGSKHSEKTKTLLSIQKAGVNHPFFGKRHSLVTKKKISESLKSAVRINIKPKRLKEETKLKLSIRSRGVSIKIFDCSNKFIKQFPTITSAAKYFNISNRTVSRQLDKNIPYMGYIFKSYIKDK